MRRGTTIFFAVNFIVLIYLVYLFSTLISLLFENGSADAILPADVPAPGAALTTPQLIPKIIHQTYINDSIPIQWKAGQQACIDLHPDYEYKLWTDAKSRAFIAENYSWFLKTFDNYQYPIERADSIRYFILSHFGGTYIDLDDGCARSLDPLLSYPAWVRFTVPTGISNDAMGSVVGHPFFTKTIKSLQHYDRNWLMPYITVMYSTGPLFLSVVWKQYMNTERPPEDHVRILMPKEYKGHDWSFFEISKGSSWHGKDAQTIFWMGKHWLLLTVSGFAIVVMVGFILWWAWSTWVMSARRTSGGRSKFGFWFGFWRKFSSRNQYEMQYYTEASQQLKKAISSKVAVEAASNSATLAGASLNTGLPFLDPRPALPL
ncbi:nucleotide-diphospho-sugar transferase [Calycina marina]|uniref:Nucleotide-diphospho-sugar transferase n=1 Tax=Calycina marina TaxID=1763456 RepID=A0A9P7YWL3_9HELO|nr:nucleotide-diphospho-sugar transferase [Calycina marina]